jgi:hypothetical protein
VKERPILFSAPMVRALLDGTKAQTRRVVKPEGAHHLFQFRGTTAAAGADEPTGEWGWCGSSHVVNKHIHCPYGQPGDRLWVRETHAPQADCWGSWERWLRGAGGEPPILHYAADFKPFQNDNGFVIRKPFIEKWRPSIHMPRWASRIDLEVTGVRVERLQDISEDDLAAEGIQELIDAGVDHDGTPRDTFRVLWEGLNGTGSWAANPWLWVVEFRRIAP